MNIYIISIAAYIELFTTPFLMVIFQLCLGKAMGRPWEDHGFIMPILRGNLNQNVYKIFILSPQLSPAIELNINQIETRPTHLPAIKRWISPATNQSHHINYILLNYILLNDQPDKN